jgi:oxygen-dependent protoporphyrinogen oxidase
MSVTAAATKPGPGTAYEITYQRDGATDRLVAPAVVVATDTISAGKLLSPLSSTMGKMLQSIEYAAVAVVGCGYRREQISHSVDGFGFLVPRKEKLRVLGTVYCSSLFPGRAPAGMVNLTSFVGGATDNQVMTTPEAELAAQAEHEVANVLGISGAPVTRVLRRWPRALPQYNLGHAEVVTGLRAELSKLPGLFLAGNYLSGASIGYCTEHAAKTVAAVESYLKSNRVM